MNIKKTTLYCFILGLMACSCGNKAVTSDNATVKQSVYEQVSPKFDSDSAYAYVKNQVDFGPRVPNSSAHAACGDYLVSELQRFGAKVTEQKLI